jgi:predicted TIM-barrel fold metal-dependent hydrolase
MSRVSSRREFLTQSAALAGVGIASSLVSPHFATTQAAEKKGKSVKEDSIRIVDTHQHLWDIKLLKLPWLKGDAVQAINRSFVMSDYLKATRGLNVTKTVYMEVNVDPSHQVKEAEYVIDLCGRDDNPMDAAVIGGYPHAESFKDYVTKMARNKYIRGVRTVLHDPDRPAKLCLEPRFVENARLLGKLGLSFDLCMRPGEILDGARLAEKCPGTRFVVDHCGNMSVTSTDKKLRNKWKAGMKAAAAQENTVCKISGIVVTAEKGSWKPADLAPNINFCLETFGEDRCYFGGDWPVCTLKATYSQWVNALKTIVADRSLKFRQKLFYDNAVKFYGLS